MGLLNSTADTVAAACRATGVAVAAGVDLAAWAAAWEAGGRVRPWRPGQTMRGRAPYLEYSVTTGDFANESMQEGGTASLTIRLAAVVCRPSQGDAEALAGAILLTALDAIRLLPGGFTGSGDSLGELVKVAGYGDVWRREATFNLTLSYNYGVRGVDPGAVSVPVVLNAFEGVLSVPWDAAGGQVSLVIPAGYVVHRIRAETVTAWNGAVPSLAIYLDPIASPMFSLSKADLLETAVAVEAQGEFSGGTQIRVVVTPGTGASAGLTRLYVSSAET